MPACRPCLICSDTSKARLAAEMVAAGATDKAVGNRLGVSRASAQRHRLAHLVAPARALVEAAAKDAPAKEKRAEIAKAIEAGNPLAFVELASIVSDLKTVHERLERTADAAETDKQRLAVASLASQQLRAAEVRAKLGGAGAYGQKAREAGEAAVFSLTIHLGDKTRRLDFMPDSSGSAPTIDMSPAHDTTVVRRQPALLPDGGDESDDEGESV
jgi:hypothetical protein